MSCPKFVPHAFKKNTCNSCFQPLEAHSEEAKQANSSPAQPAVPATPSKFRASISFPLPQNSPIAAATSPKPASSSGSSSPKPISFPVPSSPKPLPSSPQSPSGSSSSSSTSSVSSLRQKLALDAISAPSPANAAINAGPRRASIGIAAKANLLGGLSFGLPGMAPSFPKPQQAAIEPTNATASETSEMPVEEIPIRARSSSDLVHHKKPISKRRGSLAVTTLAPKPDENVPHSEASTPVNNDIQAPDSLLTPPPTPQTPFECTTPQNTPANTPANNTAKPRRPSIFKFSTTLAKQQISTFASATPLQGIDMEMRIVEEKHEEVDTELTNEKEQTNQINESAASSADMKSSGITEPLSTDISGNEHPPSTEQKEPETTSPSQENTQNNETTEEVKQSPETTTNETTKEATADQATPATTLEPVVETSLTNDTTNQPTTETSKVEITSVEQNEISSSSSPSSSSEAIIESTEPKQAEQTQE